jgi:hypothetical protein
MLAYAFIAFGERLMEVDRRGFLIAAGAVVLAPLSVKAVRWRSAAAASAHLFRPDPTGSSAGVCPRCGARDHGALDPGCPANAGPRSAVQAAARAKAAPAEVADMPEVAEI